MESKLKRVIENPASALRPLLRTSIGRNMSDEKYISLMYRSKTGRKLNLENPQRFTEKLQWLKLYDRNPEYTRLVDKYEVKKIAEERLGNDHVIPLLGVWDHFDEIDFEKLPNQFVLKTTHDSGGLAVCKDKTRFDKGGVERKLEDHLQKNFFYVGREWPYKNVKPRIIAEEYVDSLGKPESIEYKVTCFDGKVDFITVCRGIAHSAYDVRFNDFYTRDFEPLPFVTEYYANSGVENEKPKQLDELIYVCETMAAGLPTARVDCYIIDGKVYFGEVTFFTWGGFMRFIPDEWDFKLGEKLILPARRT